MSLWVVDTAPLIFLAKLGQLDLLRNGADEVITVPAVVREVDGQVAYDAALHSIESRRPCAAQSRR